jgi:hypothetical protein
MTGCEKLSFEPSVEVFPDTDKAGEPAGYGLEIRVPQNENPEDLAAAELREAVVKLPEGAGINLSDMDELKKACSEAESKLASTEPAACPYASRVGTASIKAPLIEGDTEKEFEGNIYLLGSNPPELKLLVAVSADGVNLKLVLDVDLNESTGRVTFVLHELPQLPLGELKLDFVGGAEALLVTPPSCGVVTTSTELTPWSGTGAVSDLSSFEIAEGAEGTPCAATLPFSPTFQAGSSIASGGGYGSLTFLVTRTDREADLSTIAIQAPQAAQEMFAGVPPCGEAQAAAGTCAQASSVGAVQMTVGSGPYPYYLTGAVYLTGPSTAGTQSNGAPEGLSIVVPFDPGPFALGTVVIRASAQVDAQTGQLTILSEPLPHVLDGIPVPVKDFALQLDRGEFRLNPDGCEPAAVTGTLTSTQGSAVTTSTAPLGAFSTQCTPPQAPAVSTVQTPAATATVSLAGTRVVRRGRGRVMIVKLTCTGAGGACGGELTLTVQSKGGSHRRGSHRRSSHRRSSKRVTIGTAGFSIAAGKTTTVELVLNAAGRRLIEADRGHPSARLTIAQREPGREPGSGSGSGSSAGSRSGSTQTKTVSLLPE